MNVVKGTNVIVITIDTDGEYRRLRRRLAEGLTPGHDLTNQFAAELAAALA